MATVVSTSASQYKGKEIKTLSDGSKVRVDSKTGKSGSGSKNSIDTTSQAGLDAFAAENTSAVNPALNSQSLAPAPDLKLPTPPQQPNYEGSLSSATTTVKAPSMYDQTAQPESDQYNLKGMIDAITQGMDVGAPPNTAAIYAEQERRDGIQQKQQLVNDYTAQLNAITAKAEADKLRVTGQGRGIPEVIIGGQQAQIAKEAAIEALPVAAQLAAAQGNLETAQQHVATYAKLLIDDANAKYQHKQDIFKTILPFLNAAENRRLQVLDEKNRQTREDAVNLANAKAQALSFAIQNGAPGAVRNAITSATDIVGLTQVAGGYGIDPVKKAQVANIYSEINARAAESGGQDASQILAYAQQYASTGQIPTGIAKGAFGLISQVAKELPKQDGTIVSAQTGVVPSNISSAQVEGLAALRDLTKKTAELEAMYKDTHIWSNAAKRQQYTDLRNEAIDLLTRARTGAALTAHEELTYGKKLPPLLSTGLLGAGAPFSFGSFNGAQKIQDLNSSLSNKLETSLQAHGAIMYGFSKVNLNGVPYTVGQIVENSAGQKGRVNMDGTITPLTP